MQMVPFSSLSRFRKYFAFSSPPGNSAAPVRPGFLIDGEDELQRTMRDVVALHHCQSGCHAHTIVGAERRALGLQPIAFTLHLDGIGIEVVRRALILFADHVEMTLQQSHRRRFAPRTSWFANYGVAYLIVHRFQPGRAATAST